MAKEQSLKDFAKGSEPAAEKKTKGEEYITVTRVVDRNTVSRKLMKATPSMCRECGFDVIRPQPGEPTPVWDEMDAEEKLAVKAALRRHIAKVHQDVVKDRAVVQEEDVSRKWLVAPRPI